MRALLRLALLAALLGMPCRGAGIASVEFHLVVDCKAGAQAMPVRGSEKAFCLSPDVILGTGDIIAAKRTDRGGFHDVVEIKSSPPAATRMQEATRANVGGRIGVLYNGELVSAIRILDPIRSDGTWITGLKRAEADDLVTRLNRR